MINLAQVLDQCVRLVLTDIVKKIILAVKIRQLHPVEIVKIKLPDTKTRQRDGNIAAEAAEADDGDAGIGKPSQACEAMEMGAAAIMANTAIASAGNLPLMASAFRDAINAGRSAYLAGCGSVRDTASASSPLTGFLHD